MEITLKVADQNKTYTTNFISARMVRRTIEISKDINFENISPEELDKLMDYITELFGGQFSRDDLYDGLPSQELLPAITGCINEVVGRMAEVTKGDEKNA
ncbi:phage tail assembly chaperone G [Desulfoscipio gibsoniae]|uniref:Uncharacterized protein n=1 Tax=Desulfoscipio gibsoniae DSM 7213 TaxID=767817 RepID=R4KKB9_9FIRM|nr:hypothetical protein [Desulfoscipio gibsoniae]AGL03658.1 hypothetical protein Desgi_4419 [Desulfoscipio gibsoniae DSM 7213]